MSNNTITQSNSINSTLLEMFFSVPQWLVIQEAMDGDESEGFEKKLHDLYSLITSMPRTYEQDDKGDSAIAYLHYFIGESDFYITERDVDGFVYQATGYASINGHPLELGYISIAEIVEGGAEMDLHWTPKPINKI